MSIIAQNIYRIIKEKCLSQAAIGNKVGYGAKKFNDMLRGRKIIKADDVPVIAKALGVMPSELFHQDVTDKGESKNE